MKGVHKMNPKRLYMNVLITLLIGGPICILTPMMDMPLIMEVTLWPIGIILCLIGIASSVLLIQHKGLEN
jgi:hypothetical protein